MRFVDVDPFWQVTGSSCHTKGMMCAVGEDWIRNAALAAVQQFVQRSGEVLFRNSYRFVAAKP